MSILVRVKKKNAEKNVAEIRWIYNVVQIALTI